ncbi:hypothetical protein [Kitasatospora cathayae]|uniref:Uncharacterized protein n=1 Tax=Kitasatospora cathayae TaxID=3004092 RepID=A0ABY7Q834_9ACTN|nr:hypothetical protein [Kitasatospora sp. HUAS 3-15]WBP88747.1 hypothetical protein O1G21_24870 [Kitasatospora sp. HUAS 3-15]
MGQLPLFFLVPLASVVTMPLARREQAVRRLWWRAAKAGLKRLGELEEQDRLPAEVADRLRDRQHDRLARLCPENHTEAKQRQAQWRAAAEVEQEMIAASRREMLIARSELGADPELVDHVLRGLDPRSERK